MLDTTPVFWAVVCSLVLAVAFGVLGFDRFVAAAPPPRAAAPVGIPAPTGPWSAYVAPESACPADDGRASATVHEQTMVCLINWARGRHGVPPVNASVLLMASTAEKAADLAACGEFSHDACGKPADAAFTARVHPAARTRFGENLAWGTSYSGLPRHILNGWLESDGHRLNLLRAEWREQGIAYRHARTFAGAADAHVWVSHFAAVG